MAKKKDNKDTEGISSQILLQILDELKAINRRLDAALGEAPASTSEPAHAVINLPQREPAEPAAAPPPIIPEPEEPQEPQGPNAFNLPKPASPEEEAELFKTQKRHIENFMAVAQFSQAEKLAEALSAVMPFNIDAKSLLNTIRRESTAFRTEQQGRLFAEFQRATESRQWVNARLIGEQLIERYPASYEGQTAAASMQTVCQNAHYEEARILRDRIHDMVKRKRYSEALEIAEDLIHRFPTTLAASQLQLLLPDFKRRSIPPL
jgi:hypothetical protein